MESKEVKAFRAAVEARDYHITARSTYQLSNYFKISERQVEEILNTYAFVINRPCGLWGYIDETVHSPPPWADKEDTLVGTPVAVKAPTKVEKAVKAAPVSRKAPEKAPAAPAMVPAAPSEQQKVTKPFDITKIWK